MDLTASRRNVMQPGELSQFLAAPRRIAKLATLREDGNIHLTPVWFRHEDGRFHFTLAGARVHLRNLRRTPRATLLVEEDARPGRGLDTGRAVMASGPVQLVDDPERVAAEERLITERYREIGSDQEPDVAGRHLAILSPEILLSWDFGKGP